jgi:hypothetical protein
MEEKSKMEALAQRQGARWVDGDWKTSKCARFCLGRNMKKTMTFIMNLHIMGLNISLYGLNRSIIILVGGLEHGWMIFPMILGMAASQLTTSLHHFSEG